MSDNRRPSAIVESGLWSLVFAIAVLGLTVGVIGLFVPSRGAGSPPMIMKSVVVSLREYKIEPASITVAAGTHLVLQATNNGTMEHDLQVQGGKTGTGMLSPGLSGKVDLGIVATSTEAWCTVPGHKELGMLMKISVTGTAHAASASPGPASTRSPTVDPNAAPSADWKPFDPTLAPAPGATEHKITLHAIEKKLEIAPGVTQMMWTFNGQVPAPILRGHVGDLFTVTLVNDGTVGHSLDFHASKTNMDTDMRTIQPGHSLVYQFVAQHSGIWMYHCGTAPVLHHIAMGMYGAVVIDPPNLPPVDHEYVFVQSELYFGQNGQMPTMDKMLDKQWDAVVFNGYYNQYSFKPITGVQPGQRVRVWLLAAGPSANEAFHIIGTEFDTVFKEGAYLLRPNNPEEGASQTLDLQPSQGGFVEFTFDKPGTYAMVTHNFADASKGDVGKWTVGAS